MPVVAHSIPGLDHDQVEPERQPRHRRSIRQDATIEQPVGGRPNTDALAVAREEVGRRDVGAPADLDDDQRRGWTGIDRDEVELVATDVDVSGQQGPAGVRETRSDERLGSIAGPLGCRSRLVARSVRHAFMFARNAYPAHIQPATAQADAKRLDQLAGQTTSSATGPNPAPPPWM